MSDLEDLAAELRLRASEPSLALPVRRASGAARCGAAVLDVLALMFAWNIVMAVSAPIVPMLPVLSRPTAEWALLWGAILLYTLIEIYPGNSPGKWILNLAIASADGSRATRARLLRRWLIKYAFLLFIGLREALGAWIETAWRSGTANEAAVNIARRLYEIADLAAWYTAIPVLAGLLGAFLPARRALYDWLAGTAVYDQKDVEGNPASPKGAFEVRVVSPREDDHSAPP